MCSLPMSLGELVDAYMQSTYFSKMCMEIRHLNKQHCELKKSQSTVVLCKMKT